MRQKLIVIGSQNGWEPDMSCDGEAPLHSELAFTHDTSIDVWLGQRAAEVAARAAVSEDRWRTVLEGENVFGCNRRVLVGRQATVTERGGSDDREVNRR